MSVEAWNRYLDNPPSVEKAEFDRLLTVDGADPFLAFEPLPHGRSLATGVKRLQDNTGFDGIYYRPTRPHFLSERRLLELATQQQEQFSQLLVSRDQSSLAKQVSELPLRSTGSWEEFENVLADQEYISEGVELASTFLIQAYNSIDIRLSGAREVILHLTMEPSVVDHIVAAAIGFEIDHQPGFELYVGGGRAVFLDDYVWVYTP